MQIIGVTFLMLDFIRFMRNVERVFCVLWATVVDSAMPQDLIRL